MANFAEAVIGGVVGKLVEYSLEPIKKQMKYLCCYSCNVQTLYDEIQELNIKQRSVQVSVDQALANNDVIKEEVENWLKKVEDLKTSSQNILDEVEIRRINCLCKKLWLPELHYYYSLSRKALKTANECIQHKNIEFPSISNPGIPADIIPPPASTSNNIPFESRVSFEDEIIKALKDPNVHSIGIWGIGGVGKTVMAKTIGKRVRDEKIFQRVVMVTVSQQPNIREMQRHIARELGLIFKGDSLDSQAKELHKRLTIEMSLLIIFDDIWKRLDLQEFGIPSHCKIILTSRNKDDLTSSCIPSAIIFELRILNKTESWNFFVDNLGYNIVDDDDNLEFVQIAKKVERECKGLPLALMIVASALKDKPKFFWNNALRELQSHAPDNIPSVINDVYGSLLFSINALQGKEQKDLFFLCCLFPEDYLISTEDLLRYGIGLEIFKKLRNLEDVREKVKSVLHNLLFRSLLINGDEKLENFKVRMHDVVRDVGIWMMETKGTEEHKFLIKHGLNEWPNDSLNNYSCISFSFSDDCISSFPESIVLPNLELLRLDFSLFEKYDVKLSENFFSGLGRLRVVEAFKIQLLPTSMSLLNNLRTLSLQRCRIFKMVSVLGKLIKLEILTLTQCDFEVLPIEIGNLTCLKQINILDCGNLRRIAYGVLSRLVRLEELMILNNFNCWRDEARGEDVACLSELNHLKSLTTLQIQIRNPSVLPVEKPLWFQRLKKYALIITNYIDHVRLFQKSVIVEGDVVLGDWICDMASDAEYVQFVGSNCMKFMKVLSKNCWNMRDLKILKLCELTDVQYFVQSLQDNVIFPAIESLCLKKSISLQQVCEVSPPKGSFKALENLDLIELSGLMCLWKFSINHQIDLGNLQNVKIQQCKKLSYLFSLSVAQSLVNLKSLTIEKCQTMKEIFKKEDGENMEINKIKFPKLERILLSSLDSFYHFGNEINEIELPELCYLYLCNLPRMKIENGYNKEVDQEYLIISKDVRIVGINFNFYRLQHLVVEGIENFKCMFSLSIISELSNLSNLHVENCSLLEKVIEKNDGNVRRPNIFPNLKKIRLSNLPNLRNFCYNDIQFPSLWSLDIERCPLMLKFVEEVEDYTSSSTAFLDEKVECPKLEILNLKSLNILEAFSSSFFFKSLTVLKDLYIRYCERLECVITKEEEEEKKGEGGGEISLRHLHLNNLPKLRGSIFPMRKGLKFPLLQRITIKDCPMLEKISKAELLGIY